MIQAFNLSNLSVKEFYHFSKKEEEEDHEESADGLDLTTQLSTLQSQSKRWFRLSKNVTLFNR